MKRFYLRRSFFLAFALWAFGAPLLFAQAGPTISLTVDATQAPLKVLHTRLEIPVTPGPLTLHYPKWMPGMHQPSGPLANLTGMKLTSGGKTIPWRRDRLDLFTFHADVPRGADRLDVAFDYLEPSGFGGSPVAGSATDKLLVLNWHQVVLYPDGTPAARIFVQPKLLLPPGWKFGTALPVANSAAAEVAFQTVALDRLVDSPLIAGEYFRVIDLTPPGEPIHHEIDLVADSEAALAMSPEVQRGLTNLVAETGKLFGSRHYRAYHFLLTLSDHMGHFGIEHHESNDSRLPERVFLSPGAAREAGGLLAHEFAHSWSGKFRRPHAMNPPDFQAPMETDLLWVYEGNTSYLGNLLATRSGLWTPEDYRQSLAGSAASLGPGRPGRTWRPLLDTAGAVPGMFGGGAWGNWRRGSDYYEEGELIWLEVANIIHERSRGEKSFEDFFHLFYGGPNNGPEVKTYTFEELTQLLNQVVAYDWAGFFQARLTSLAAEAPSGGIEASGWKVVYTGEAIRGSRGPSSSTYSIGFNLAPDGSVTDSFYGGLAFQAGIAPGMKVAGVNGRVFKPEFLADAIRASRDSARPIELLVVADDYYKICTIDYHAGERYPHLVRDSAKPDYLSEILKPLAKQ
jgi:predicted metalloprotease with PDZ domain